MSDTEIETALSAFIVLSAHLYLLLRKNKKPRQRRWWMTTHHKTRNQYDGTRLLSNLIQEPSGQFDNFCRMSSIDFEYLLQLIGPRIKKQDTVFRDSIPTKVRLAVTLRFLATGDSFKSLHYLFKISPQVISLIVPEVCKALCEALRSFVKMPQNEHEWLEIAREFEIKWQFPHCLGAIDGKHIKIQSPINSGSEFYNYKHNFSIILLAVADSDYNFLFADVGTHGRMSDGGVFNDSMLYNKIYGPDSFFPQDAPLPDRHLPVPYVFVADGAFALSKRIMKPFPGTPPVGSQNRKFNSRLSRARVVIECAFGIMTSVFGVLKTNILLQPEKASIITLTCVVLHNFLKKSQHSYRMYMPEGNIDNVLEEQQLRSLDQVPIRTTENAREIRNEYASYFYSH
ncbi:unnamed protein product [Parnassius mnemosyne]|uniref:DDE Tnp4 domain-containing protein n=1 Tax=Parnassius mnemosyne TaxID=213953 RepID=A0AAV1KIX8_9NEOP